MREQRCGTAATPLQITVNATGTQTLSVGNASWSPTSAPVQTLITGTVNSALSSSLAAGDTISYAWAVGGVWISPIAPSAECFTSYNGSEIIAWPSGTNNASPTFNATFFEAGEYIIQVNVTATIKHSGGTTTTLNATGYIGGDQSDIVGSGASQANVETAKASTPQQKTGTNRVTVTAATGDTYAELILINIPGTYNIEPHHMYIKFNRQSGTKPGTIADTYGFWPVDLNLLRIWLDGKGQVEHPDDDGETATQGHDVANSSDPVFLRRLRKICDGCVENPPPYGFVPIFYVCMSWAIDAWQDAWLGTGYIYPGSPPPPYASQIPPWAPSK